MEDWIYETGGNDRVRYVLGKTGDKPLICFGINPSTAKPGALDNTLKSVERMAKLNGYDSWIMLNVYPQRATNPNDIHKRKQSKLHQENLRHIKQIFDSNKSVDIWAAWGTLIEKRSFLKSCLLDIIEISKQSDCKWIQFGKASIKGHPHHPLYLKKTEKPKSFDMTYYIELM